MEFETQICTTMDQSERLLALGLKKETADMHYTNASLPFEKDKFHLECKDYLQLQKEAVFQICPFTFIPAWSLHRLIDIAGVHYLELLWHEGIYEQVIALIEERISEGLINRKYLEESLCGKH